MGWPHARRDSYSAPQRIPEEHRQPLARDIALVPWEAGVAAGGLPFDWAAETEGGPRNGVLTALEDFVGEGRGLRLAVVPAFFGFGAVWHEDAPWASAVASIVEPWDRNPLLERLEANRIVHLVERWRLAYGIADAMPRWRLQEQQEALLRTMLDSGAFTWAERASRLRQRGRPAFSREQLREALGERPAELSRRRQRPPVARGTPTTVVSSGTSSTTTALAPTEAPAPTVTAPITLAPGARSGARTDCRALEAARAQPDRHPGSDRDLRVYLDDAVDHHLAVDHVDTRMHQHRIADRQLPERDRHPMGDPRQHGDPPSPQARLRPVGNLGRERVGHPHQPQHLGDRVARRSKSRSARRGRRR